MLGFQPLAIFLFNIFPDSLFFFKIIMFLCFFLSVLFLWLIVRNFFDDRIAWLSIFVVLALSPVFLFSFGNFENEIFAYPLLFFSFWLLISQKSWVKWLSLVSLGVACLFWGGSAYFIVGLVPLWLFLSVPSVLLLVFFTKTFFDFLNPTFILESRIFAGFFDLFLLILTIPFIFGIKNKKLWLSFGIILVFVALQGKLNLLLLPFLVLGVGFFISKIEFNKYLTILCIVLLFGWQVAFFFQQPTQDDWSVIDKTVELQKETGYKVYNDWSVGYWLNIKGIDTKYRGGGNNPDYNNLVRPFIGLTQKELDCNLIASYSNPVRGLNLYKCI